MKELYIIPHDTRYKPYNIQIKSTGTKYITTIDGYRFIKTLKPPYYSTEDSRGWNPQLVAYNSKEQFEYIKSLQSKKQRLISMVTTHINECCDNEALVKIATVFNIKDL